MPELPEIETVRQSLLARVAGARIADVRVRDARLRVPVDAAALRARLPGRRIVDVRRRAKYLLVDLEGDLVLLVHLGMSGRLGVVAGETPLARHDHVIFDLEDGRRLQLNDPRRFGLVVLLDRREEASYPALACLGVEPLDDGFTGEALFAATRGRERSLKTFLMDAARLVGVGNIYASEALFRARLHPALAAKKLTRSQARSLARAVKQTLRDAIVEGGTTLRDFADAEGAAGHFGSRLRVYGRAGQSCRRCKGPIRRMIQAGRSTFYCGRCQKR